MTPGLRLLVIGLNFAPEITGVGKYTGEMAAWLAGRGHAVSVVTTEPYYPEWKRASGLRRWTWRAEIWQGCRVTRCPLYVPRRISGARRVLHLGSFALSSIPAAAARLIGGRADIVAAIAPTLLSAPLALATARLISAKAWLHVQDLEIDAAFGLGIIRSARVIDGMRRAERWIARRFDLVSAISPRMVDALERKGVARERLMLFPNWVDTSRIFPLSGSSALRRELGIPDDRCIVLYSGSMGRKQGLEHVIAAARELQSASARSPLFVLAGAGPGRGELERAAQGLPNVTLLPLQPDERFNEFLNIGDIHLLPQRRDADDLVMPSKLGAMLAVGKPVIATVPPTSQIALILGEAGVIVPPEDPLALAAAIRDLASDAVRRRPMGAAALRVARTSLEAETILRRAETQIMELASATAAGRPTPR